MYLDIQFGAWNIHDVDCIIFGYWCLTLHTLSTWKDCFLQTSQQSSAGKWCKVGLQVDMQLKADSISVIPETAEASKRQQYSSFQQT